MTFLTVSIAALVVLHIYHRIGVAITKADILANALDAHLSTGKDYRADIEVAKDHGLAVYTLGEVEPKAAELPGIGRYRHAWRVDSFGIKHPSNDRGHE